MFTAESVKIPGIVRIKPGALARLGIYCRRENFQQVLVVVSEGLPENILATVREGLSSEGVAFREAVADGCELEKAGALFIANPGGFAAVAGVGGGKALDIAKYVAFLSQKPYFAVPTSLSNDGFCSPQSSLTVKGRRFSLPSAVPHAVVVDTEVCLAAPKSLWLSGVGDLASKLTAVRDWKWAFHNAGTPVNDLAALMSDASVYQFIARPERDVAGMRLLATALMLNGVAMTICGSSRPASGAEHLVSHALDAISANPRLHGWQVGMATYALAAVMPRAEEERKMLENLFTATGFFEAVRAAPFSFAEWDKAVDLAPTIKDDFASIISLPAIRAGMKAQFRANPLLKGCFA